MMTPYRLDTIEGKTRDQLEAYWQLLSNEQDELIESETDANFREVERKNRELVWLMIEVELALGEEYGAWDLPPHLQHMATF